MFTAYLKCLQDDNLKLVAELKSTYEKLELVEAENAKLQNKTINVPLIKGKYLFYGYECNNMVKFGTSFSNVNGQRPKSHRTSVPNLAIGFVVYSSKSNLQDLNRSTKSRFNIKGRCEHLDCKIDELESFVIRYLDLMEADYVREDIQTLKLLAISLRS